MAVLKIALILITIVYLIKLIIFVINLFHIHIKSKCRPVRFARQEDIIECSKDSSQKIFQEIIPPVKPILEFWENESNEGLDCLIGDDFRDRIGNSQ